MIARRTRKPAPHRTGLRLSLRCACGGTLSTSIPIRPTDAIRMRDIYLRFHREPGCVVTDTSEDVE